MLGCIGHSSRNNSKGMAARFAHVRIYTASYAGDCRGGHGDVDDSKNIDRWDVLNKPVLIQQDNAVTQSPPKIASMSCSDSTDTPAGGALCLFDGYRHIMDSKQCSCFLAYVRTDPLVSG